MHIRTKGGARFAQYYDELNNTKYDYLQHALNARVAEEGEKDPNELDTRPSTPTVEEG